MRRQPIAIVGSNISALVSAIFCARQGLPVIMIGSRKHVGGHFGGMVVENARFDVGMLFFEFTSFKSKPEVSISTYQDEELGDAGRFVSMKLHRDLDVTQKTAWFMLHRIREACSLVDVLGET